MSLADGEYEIDISELLDLSSIAPVDEPENIAIRYGFMPDSMDQTQPLRLYQADQECLLKAHSTDGPEKPIIFEGLTQKHRPGDAYYLTYNPQEKDRVSLRRLASTIRFSKSRNAQKLDAKLSQWEREARDRHKQKPSKPTTSSKRPPTANNTPEPKRDEPIISESDFDDLEFDKEQDQKRQGGEHQVKARKKQVEAQSEKQRLDAKAPPKARKKVVRKKSGPIIERVEGEAMDLDDDFKDLEDQLQEVLEEEDEDTDVKLYEEPKSILGRTNQHEEIHLNDSDESDADDFQFSGIKTNENNDNPPQPTHRYSDTFGGAKSGSKPMSLRDLIGGDKPDEDLSSSEEE